MCMNGEEWGRMGKGRLGPRRWTAGFFEQSCNAVLESDAAIPGQLYRNGTFSNEGIKVRDLFMKACFFRESGFLQNCAGTDRGMAFLETGDGSS